MMRRWLDRAYQEPHLFVALLYFGGVALGVGLVRVQCWMLGPDVHRGLVSVFVLLELMLVFWVAKYVVRPFAVSLKPTHNAQDLAPKNVS